MSCTYNPVSQAFLAKHVQIIPKTDMAKQNNDSVR